MKLLVLAQIPPPTHGQSTMVRTLVEDLGADGIELVHVNLRVSDRVQEIGKWQARKVFRVLLAGIETIVRGKLRQCDTLYYVPAPGGKRAALWRDWLLMALCRPWFRRLVLHWHAPGLGKWLQVRATPTERVITRALLSHADLSIVLARSLRADAALLSPTRIRVVPNGVDDPGPPKPRVEAAREFTVLFLGLCHESKGVFAAVDAVLAVNRRRSDLTELRLKLDIAGPCEDLATEARLRQLQAKNDRFIQIHGEIGSEQRTELLDAADVLCLPTSYEAEGMPLVVLEAFARDRPVIASAWRGLSEIVPPEVGWLVPPGSAEALASALEEAVNRRLPCGAPRKHFLQNYTRKRHVQMLAEAMRALDSTAERSGP